MNPSEEFRRFAGECRAMGKFTRSPESKATWDRLAARWVQLAELNEKSISNAAAATLVRLRNRQSISRRVLTASAT
jgi:hypothetical protein